VQRVVPVGRKISKLASESLKYRHFALRAMLPVIAISEACQELANVNSFKSFCHITHKSNNDNDDLDIKGSNGTNGFIRRFSKSSVIAKKKLQLFVYASAM